MCINGRHKAQGTRCKSGNNTCSLPLAPCSLQRGISLIELIMFIVIVSIALSGVMLVMNQVTGHSADTLLRKQALTAAESLLEEIEAQTFWETASSPVAQGVSRTTASHNVMDYNNFATTGIYAIDGTLVTGLNSYSLATTVVPAALGNIPQASSVLITVTVTEPGTGEAIAATGYRTAYY